jgi:hypothetical protein
LVYFAAILVYFAAILVYFEAILVYFAVILVYFEVILVYFSRFGMLYQEKIWQPWSSMACLTVNVNVNVFPNEFEAGLSSRIKKILGNE